MYEVFVLVPWPESQELMEEPWFNDEAILADNSSYLIPESRIINNDYILQKSAELALQLESMEIDELAIYQEWDSGTPFEGGMSVFESVLNLKLLES